jgi:hypothetical protein
MGIRKNLFFIAITFFSFLESNAQSNASLFTQKYNAFQTIWRKTKLHLIFNQEKFFPGDTAYFKVYLVNEELIGIKGKQLIDVNLIDSRGHVKIHFISSLNNGVGQNQLIIPDTLAAGAYLVTAHNSWMKNFDPTFIFKKEIAIARKNALSLNETAKLIAVAEGSHLVRGVPSKISILTNKPRTSVQIIDSEGRDISQVTTDAQGMGAITFVPLQNAAYFGRIIGESFQTALPIVESDGISLQLSVPGKLIDPLKIRLASPQGSTLRNQELLIILSSRGKISHTENFIQGDNEFVELTVSQLNLPEGVIHLSLLNQAGNLLASRDFYRQGGGSVQAKIQTKDKFQTREKVEVEVSLMDSIGKSMEGEFSISVLNASLFDSEKKNSLVDELTILSNVKEKFLIDRSDSNWLTSLDNRLICLTEEVQWKNILSKKTDKPPFSLSGLTQKRGSVSYADSGKPALDLDILFYLQKSKARVQTKVENGKVWLTVPEFFGKDELFFIAEKFFYLGGEKHGEEVSNLKIEWEEDKSFNLPSPPISKEGDSPDKYASFAANSRLIDQSYGFFVSNEKTKADNGKLRIGDNDFEEEVAKADFAVDVQKYNLFPTMEELVKEVIPSLFHRKTGRKSIVRVSLPEVMSAKATGDPLYIIDGTATKNTTFFLSLKPSEIITVKIVNDLKKLLPLGLMGKNGIVIVQTKKGDVRESNPDPSLLIQGFSKPINFAEHNTSNLYRPNFRSTIYWSPSVKTDSNGKALVEFFCSDDIGKLKIRIEGLTNEGRPFTTEANVEVILGTEKN